MSRSSIAARIKQLRREIEVIQQEEHRYRSHSSRSLAENAEHDKRERRLIAIRNAFRTLLETAKQPQQTKPAAIHAGGGGPLRPLITCPECGVHLREDRLQRHLARKHRIDSSPRYTPPTFPKITHALIPCSECGVHLRENRLQRHLAQMHGEDTKLPQEQTGIPVEKASFQLLPPGTWTVDDIISHYPKEANRLPPGSVGHEIQWSRLTAITSLGPIKCYVGTELWLGYVLFEFSDSHRVILKSL
jgi:hypothetical protein